MKKRIFLWVLVAIPFVLVYIFYNPEQYLFPKCIFRMLTGFLCPGCGSQRAIYHTLHGNFAEAFRLNFLLFPAIMYAMTGVITSHLFPDKWQIVRTRFYGLNATYASLIIIITFWIGRNVI